MIHADGYPDVFVLLVTAVLLVGGCSPAKVRPNAPVEVSEAPASCEDARTLQRDLSLTRRFDPDTQIYVTETGDLCRFAGR